MGLLVRTDERWQMRSAQGPVQLMIHPASTRSSFAALVPELVRAAIAQQHAAGAAVGHVDGEDFGVIADDRSGVDRLGQPLGDQALGKFALRVFVIEDRPLDGRRRGHAPRASIPSR